MSFSIIVAADEQGGIGKDNRIPWHIKEDLIRLSKMTRGHIAVIGSSTYQSMVGYYDRSGKEMPAREYVVLVKNADFKSARNNTFIATSIPQALEHIKKTREKEIFIIGGASIYKQLFSLADKIYLTRVSGKFNCDTFFPKIRTHEWTITKSVPGRKIIGEPNFSFVIYEKKK